jgi:hypothetical protein
MVPPHRKNKAQNTPIQGQLIEPGRKMEGDGSMTLRGGRLPRTAHADHGHLGEVYLEDLHPPPEIVPRHLERLGSLGTGEIIGLQDLYDDEALVPPQDLIQRQGSPAGLFRAPDRRSRTSLISSLHVEISIPDRIPPDWHHQRFHLDPSYRSPSPKPTYISAMSCQRPHYAQRRSFAP